MLGAIDFEGCYWLDRESPRAHHTFYTTRFIMAETKEDTRTWPELAIGLYDKLTGRGAEITYDFEDFELHVPSKVGSGAEYAQWKMNGKLKIRTTDEENQ